MHQGLHLGKHVHSSNKFGKHIDGVLDDNVTPNLWDGLSSTVYCMYCISPVCV